MKIPMQRATALALAIVAWLAALFGYYSAADVDAFLQSDDTVTVSEIREGRLFDGPKPIQGLRQKPPAIDGVPPAAQHGFQRLHHPSLGDHDAVPAVGLQPVDEFPGPGHGLPAPEGICFARLPPGPRDNVVQQRRALRRLGKVKEHFRRLRGGRCGADV